MQRRVINPVFVLVLVFLTLAGVFGINWYHSYLYNRNQVIAGPEVNEVKVYIEPDTNATRSAANYLIGSIKHELGIEPQIVTEQEEGFQYISILCGEDSNIADPEAPVYTISLEETGIIIHVPMVSRCFGAVKAVADQWLQEGCGINEASELVLSQAIIDQQLSFLSTYIDGQIKVLSQNLRNRDDGEGKTIEERAVRFFQLVDEYQPDLIGTQECSHQWLQLLQQHLSDRYEIYGSSRMGKNSQDGDWNVILYRKDRFSFQDGDTFWLSNTPSEEASKLNYDGSPRICTWALLQDSETGKAFLFSNTHLHHVGSASEIRTRQADILLQQLRKNDNIKKYPGFLIGDFNGTPDEPFYSLITEVYDDSRTTAIENSSSVEYTFQSYGTKQILCDYCFHSPDNLTVLDYRVLNDQYEGYVSDHYGVLINAVIS